MTDTVNKTIILHAPNINTGGGLFLLLQLIHTPGVRIQWAQLDERAKASIDLSNTIFRRYVKKTFFSRLLAEWHLWRRAKKQDTILCFHGLTPLFPIKAKVFILMQNRLVFEKTNSLDISFIAKAYLYIQKLWLRLTHKQTYQYIVPTLSMAELVKGYLGDIKLHIFSFGYLQPILDGINPTGQSHFDFVYVASGEPHKNHKLLLEAWRLLAEAGLKPSLALTVDMKKYPELYETIYQYQQQYHLNINNLGYLSSDDVSRLYQCASALVFPSKVEALGLPLLDASRHGLPIIAPELDYVRDVVVPVETFDPNSALSLVRAIKRFLKQDETILPIYTAQDFLALL